MKFLLIICFILSINVQSVLAAGVDSNIIKSAISSKNSQRVKDLLEVGYGDYNKQNKEKEFMVAAVESGDTGIVKVLLEHGIDINVYSIDTSGSAWSGNENLISTAIPLVAYDYGLIPKSKNKNNSSQRASLKGKGKVKSDTPPKRNLANDKGIDMINFLIEKGYKPMQFRNPINSAIYEKRLGLIPYLHDKGITIPLESVFSIVDKLYGKEADPAVYDALDYVLEKGGADINYIGNKKQTALVIATAKLGNLDLVKYLVGKGAKNIKDYYKKSPLDYATKYGNIDFIKVLKNAD